MKTQSFLGQFTQSLSEHWLLVYFREIKLRTNELYLNYSLNGMDWKRL